MSYYVLRQDGDSLTNPKLSVVLALFVLYSIVVIFDILLLISIYCCLLKRAASRTACFEWVFPRAIRKAGLTI